VYGISILTTNIKFSVFSEFKSTVTSHQTLPKNSFRGTISVSKVIAVPKKSKSTWVYMPNSNYYDDDDDDDNNNRI
jgi:hypothetical protein